MHCMIRLLIILTMLNVAKLILLRHMRCHLTSSADSLLRRRLWGARSFLERPLSLLYMSSSSASTQQRLERIISNRGVGSRKEIQALLKQGRVSINSEKNVVRSGAEKYDVNVEVFIDRKRIAAVPLLTSLAGEFPDVRLCRLCVNEMN